MGSDNPDTEPGGGNRIAFGPVPSRRLGRSLGINNIPPKHCSYSCVYCQVGPTASPEIEPRAFYTPERIREAVERQVEAVLATGERIDYLTFVPDGEPTLDANLAEAIGALRPLGIPVAVISNASLTWRGAVRAALRRADWVSLKVDTVDERCWRRINRAHPDLRLDRILAGIETLGGEFAGELVTETMLVAGVNDDDASVEAVAGFLERLSPSIAYLAVPTRPGAESGVVPPSEQRVTEAYQLLSGRVPRVEYLIGYEGNAFASSGDVVEDLLSITAVHPMREEAVRALLSRAGAEWTVVEALIRRGLLKETRYGERRFYVRRMAPR